MATKHTQLNFFQIVPANPVLGRLDGRQKALEIRDSLRTLKDIEFSPLWHAGNVLVIPKPLTIVDGYYVGTIFHIQMKNIPPSMNSDTYSIKGLDLDELDGLAKATCFLIDPQANLLVIERGTGVTDAALCRYLYKTLGCQKLTTAVIINPSQLEDFYRMTTVVRFETRLAKVEEGSVFGDNNRSIQQIVESADETDADKLSYLIELSAEHKRGGATLSISKISGFIRRLLRYRETEEVESLRVSGRIEDSEKVTTLDLISQRLTDDIEYEIEDRIIRSFNLSERIQEIENKYANHRQSLLSTYRFATED